MSWWLMILIGWVAMTIAMTGVWLFHRRTGNAGIVDVGWTFGVGVLGVAFSLGSVSGNWNRRLIVAVLVAIWALRLGLHIIKRVSHEPEDGRYQSLKKGWGDKASWRMFLFCQAQAFASLLFALPMLIAGHADAPLQWSDAVALVVWFIAFSGEAIADWQLSTFRSNPRNQGQVCQTRLWRYSRHPNYFFEWLHWWAYFFFAISTPLGYIAIFAPLVMFYLITQVTGIPPTEAQAIASRGDAYRRYQKTTNAFIPWWPRSERSDG